MPLPANTLRKLTSYQMTRNGMDLPNTAAGPLSQAACWSWAAAGDLVAVVDQTSANSVYDSITNLNRAVNPVALTSFNDLRAFYGCDAQFDTLAADQAAAIGGNVPAQQRCSLALMTIFLTQSGLNVLPGAGHQYQIHLKTRSWFGWDHWAVSVLLNDGRRMFIQTVTGVPVAVASDRIWDEHLPEHVVGVTDLLPAHIATINTTPLVPVRWARCTQAGCTREHGLLPSLSNSWHRCGTCGSVWCPVHGAALGGKLGRFDGTRQCGAGGCGGRTTLI